MATESSRQPEVSSHDVDPCKLPRVLALADHLGHPDGKVHGGTTYFTTVWPKLVERGVPLTACFMQPEHPAAGKLRDAGVETIFLGRSPRDMRVTGDVKRLIDKLRPGIIHSASLKSMYFSRRYAHRVGAKTVIHLHDTKRLTTLIRWMQKSVARRTGLALAVSNAVAELAVLDFGVDRSLVRTLHNGIELKRFQQPMPDARAALRSELGLPADAKLVATIGRLSEMKGQRFIIEAIPAIRNRVPGTVLLLIGEGEDRARLETLIRQLNVSDCVKMIGQRSDIPAVLAALDAVAMPSIWGEGMPYAAIEAIASSVPVVAFPTAGIPDVVIDGQTGLLVPSRDVPALASALSRLLGDAGLRGRLSQGAARHAEAFSLRQHVARLVCLYHDLLASPATPRIRG